MLPVEALSLWLRPYILVLKIKGVPEKLFSKLQKSSDLFKKQEAFQNMCHSKIKKVDHGCGYAHPQKLPTSSKKLEPENSNKKLKKSSKKSSCTQKKLKKS